MVTARHRRERFLRHIRSKNERVPNCVSGAGAVMMLDCMTCKWIRWSASIPLIFLLGAAGFVIFAHVAEARDAAPIALLGLYLATWSYVLGVAGVALLLGWWLWKWLHMRTTHALRPC